MQDARQISLMELTEKMLAIRNEVLDEFDNNHFQEWEKPFKQEWKIELHNLLSQFLLGIVVRLKINFDILATAAFSRLCVLASLKN